MKAKELLKQNGNTAFSELSDLITFDGVYFYSNPHDIPDIVCINAGLEYVGTINPSYVWLDTATDTVITNKKCTESDEMMRLKGYHKVQNYGYKIWKVKEVEY